MTSWYDAEIAVIADKHALPIDLVTAVVLVESAGRTDAFRMEPLFWDRYMRNKPEWDGANPRRVASSYGLMQVMYTTALEFGYPGEDPPEGLFVPLVGLEYGCRVLRDRMDWAKGNPESALAAYNGGKPGNAAPGVLRNGDYARRVLTRLAEMQKSAREQADTRAT
jgi:soluble lytic murein transglycosylase-like protein